MSLTTASSSTSRAAVLVVSLLVSCANGSPTTPEQRLPSDATRAGLPGDAGPFEVHHTRWHAQSRVTETITVDATYAIADDGIALPVVVFLQRGEVDVSRYGWLFDHIASRGFVCIAPSHFASIASFEPDNATIALESAMRLGFVRTGAKIAISGQAIGGIVAATTFAKDERYAGLVLIASYPDPAPEPNDTSQRGRAVLAIAGETDEKIPADDVRTGIARYASPRAFASIPGMNHFAWTDAPTPKEISADGPLGVSLEEARRQALFVLDTWLDATLRDDAAAAIALEAFLLPDDRR